MHGEAPATQIGIVDDVVVDQRGGMDEFHHRRIEGRAIAGVAREASGHEQNGRTDALTPAGSNVLADLRDQIDVRLEVPLELAIDLGEVGAYRLEDLCEIRRRFL